MLNGWISIWNVTCSSEGQIRKPAHHVRWRDRTWLGSHFADRWNGRRETTKWLPPSPHRTLCDFTVSGWAKTVVKLSKPGIINNLYQTGDTFGVVLNQFLRGNVESVSFRLQKCVCACVCVRARACVCVCVYVCAGYCDLCWHLILNFGAKSTMPIPCPIQGSFFLLFSGFTPPK